VVVAAIDGVIKLFEVSPPALVCSTVPAVNAEYQVNVPPVVLDAERDTVPAPQREAAVTDGAAGKGLTVAATAMRGVLSQVPVLTVT
jgi:hypothetical protein